MKKNNTAEKTILDAKKLTKALKEGTEKSLRDIMNEAISNLVMEEENDDEIEDDSYDVEDVDTEETPNVPDETDAAEETEEAPEVADDKEDSEEEDDDEWSDLEKYKVGDNDYDFTGVEGDEILKVYNKLGDDDQIFVKKEDDGTYSVKDDETGAEFVIELDPEALEGEADNDELDDEEPSVDFGDEEPEDDEEFSVELDDEEPEDDEIEIDINDDDEEELNEENLGYTDSYQKDVFDKKFNMSEPADSKTTNDWDDGAPKGAEKPWAGKGDGQPFEKKVNECPVATEDDANLAEEEIEEDTTINQRDPRHMTKTQVEKHRPNAPAYDVRKVDSPLEESVRKIVEKAKQIQAENKQYKACVDEIKKSLYEAAVLNVNLGKLVDILVNESMTKDEKKKICERFNNVKTINEGKALHQTIKSELKEAKASSPIVEKQFVAESKNLNETTIYQNTNNPSIDLMNRMDNLYK